MKKHPLLLALIICAGLTPTIPTHASSQTTHAFSYVSAGALFSISAERLISLIGSERKYMHLKRILANKVSPDRGKAIARLMLSSAGITVAVLIALITGKYHVMHNKKNAQLKSQHLALSVANSLKTDSGKIPGPVSFTPDSSQLVHTTTNSGRLPSTQKDVAKEEPSGWPQPEERILSDEFAKSDANNNTSKASTLHRATTPTPPEADRTSAHMPVKVGAAPSEESTPSSTPRASRHSSPARAGAGFGVGAAVTSPTVTSVAHSADKTASPTSRNSARHKYLEKKRRQRFFALNAKAKEEKVEALKRLQETHPSPSYQAPTNGGSAQAIAAVKKFSAYSPTQKKRLKRLQLISENSDVLKKFNTEQKKELSWLSERISHNSMKEFLQRLRSKLNSTTTPSSPTEKDIVEMINQELKQYKLTLFFGFKKKVSESSEELVKRNAVWIKKLTPDQKSYLKKLVYALNTNYFKEILCTIHQISAHQLYSGKELTEKEIGAIDVILQGLIASNCQPSTPTPTS